MQRTPPERSNDTSADVSFNAHAMTIRHRRSGANGGVRCAHHHPTGLEPGHVTDWITIRPLPICSRTCWPTAKGRRLGHRPSVFLTPAGSMTQPTWHRGNLTQRCELARCIARPGDASMCGAYIHPKPRAVGWVIDPASSTSPGWVDDPAYAGTYRRKNPTPRLVLA